MQPACFPWCVAVCAWCVPLYASACACSATVCAAVQWCLWLCRNVRGVHQPFCCASVLAVIAWWWRPCRRLRRGGPSPEDFARLHKASHASPEGITRLHQKAPHASFTRRRRQIAVDFEMLENLKSQKPIGIIKGFANWLVFLKLRLGLKCSKCSKVKNQ